VARVTVYAEPVLVGSVAPEGPHPGLAQVVADLNRAGIPAQEGDNIWPTSGARSSTTAP
jgi:hypothetical protein